MEPKKIPPIYWLRSRLLGRPDADVIVNMYMDQIMAAPNPMLGTGYLSMITNAALNQTFGPPLGG